MSDRTQLWKLRPIDLRWVLVGYCFFVVFHMLPSFFIADVNLFSFGRELEILPTLWLFLGLAGVSYYIALRSHGVTIVEPGISAILYSATLTLASGHFTGQNISVRSVGTMYVVGMCIFVTAVVSAWLGEKVQMRKEGKA